MFKQTNFKDSQIICGLRLSFEATQIEYLYKVPDENKYIVLASDNLIQDSYWLYLYSYSINSKENKIVFLNKKNLGQIEANKVKFIGNKIKVFKKDSICLYEVGKNSIEFINEKENLEETKQGPETMRFQGIKLSSENTSDITEELANAFKQKCSSFDNNNSFYSPFNFDSPNDSVENLSNISYIPFFPTELPLNEENTELINAGIEMNEEKELKLNKNTFATFKGNKVLIKKLC